MKKSSVLFFAIFIGFSIMSFAQKTQELSNPTLLFDIPEEPTTIVCFDTISNLMNLEVGQRLRIKCLHYQRGSKTVIEDSKPLLNELYEVLQKNPKLKIRIEGHICCTNEPDEGPKSLSGKRAKTVYEYLINRGINANRLSYKGLGHTQPLVDPEITEEDQFKNRRIEILVLER